MRLYPAQIRAWIGHHGGLTPKLIQLAATSSRRSISLV